MCRQSSKLNLRNIAYVDSFAELSHTCKLNLHFATTGDAQWAVRQVNSKCTHGLDHHKILARYIVRDKTGKKRKEEHFLQYWHRKEILPLKFISEIHGMIVALTFGSVSSIMSRIAASLYSRNASAFLMSCSASARALLSMANASASPFSCSSKIKTRKLSHEQGRLYKCIRMHPIHPAVGIITSLLSAIKAFRFTQKVSNGK